MFSLKKLLYILGAFLCHSHNNDAINTPLHIDTKYPCAFIDTINITDSYNLNTHNDTDVNNKIEYVKQSAGNWFTQPASNLTYIHDSMSIPRELVAIYDFVISNGVRVPAERHLRACVCKLKPCIRFCCEQAQYYDVTSHACRSIAFDVINGSQLDQSWMLTYNSNGSANRVETAKHFNIHIGTPCERMRTIFNDPSELVIWNLFENGTIAYKNHLFSKHYCYSPYQVENKTWIWEPLACTTERIPFVVGVLEWTYIVCLILSIICMSIILFIHLFCTEMRNTFYGVAIKAYTLCIMIGYSLMIHLMLTDPAKMSKTCCVLMACFVLLFFLLSFYILTFISFNFYLNFHGVILTKLMFWLIFFPIVSLAVGWSLFVSCSNYDGKSVFGINTCWFDPRTWAIMVYFYAPVFVACVVSIFFYILTQIKILEGRENEAKTISATLEENRYNSFWKFFCYTFLMWLICVVSFVINYNRGERTHINYAVCLAVALHGFGSLYALVGKNQQIQNFLRRIEDDIDDEDEEICESAIPMTAMERN